MEEVLTLDELFLLYERTGERQERLMKTIAAALGASPSDEKKPDVYKGGPIVAHPTSPEGKIDISRKTTLFGYETVEKTE